LVLADLLAVRERFKLQSFRFFKHRGYRMVERVLCSVGFVLLGTLACQQQVEIAAEQAKPVEVDIAVEEAAIKAVLEKQTAAYSNRNLEGEAEVWAHEPYVYRGPANGVLGWEALRSLYDEEFRTGSGPPWSFQNYDFHIHVAGDVAWAVYDQTKEIPNEQGELQSELAWECRILEKRAGEWKIVLQMGGPYPDEVQE